MDMTPNPNHQARLEFAQRQLAAVERFFSDVREHPLMKQRCEYFPKWRQWLKLAFASTRIRIRPLDLPLTAATCDREVAANE